MHWLLQEFFPLRNASAQTHKDTTLGQKIDKTAKKVGHKTAEIAANGASAVVDKKYEGKWAPTANVYINKHSHYYYISKKGHRIYLKKSQLMDKPKDVKFSHKLSSIRLNGRLLLLPTHEKIRFNIYARCLCTCIVTVACLKSGKSKLKGNWRSKDGVTKLKITDKGLPWMMAKPFPKIIL